MGNLIKRYKTELDADGKRVPVGGFVYYCDYVDLRTGQRVQKSLRTDDLKVAKLRLREYELATSDSGPHQDGVPSTSLSSIS